MEFESKTIKKVRSTSVKESFYQLGRYMSLDRIIHKEGGRHSRSAIVAGMKYARNAYRLGHDMLRWNPLTERVDIFYVEVGHRTQFDELWAKVQTSQVDVEVEPSAKRQKIAAAAPLDPKPAPDTPRESGTTPSSGTPKPKAVDTQAKSLKLAVAKATRLW